MRRTRWGLLATGLYLLAVALLVFWKRATLAELPLNAIGDFLAGAFGPLAFLWLVLGYLQQGDQLKQNSDALMLQAKELQLGNKALQMQAEELRNSVSQQSQLVEVTRQQVEIDRESIKFERQRAEVANRPRFTLTPIGQTKSGSHNSYKLELKNCGNYAHEIDVQLEKEEDSTDLWRAPSLGPGEKGAFYLNIEGDLGDGHCIVVKCLDVSSNHAIEMFYIEVDPANKAIHVQKSLSPNS